MRQKPRNLILIGYRATGKTTLAQGIAERLNVSAHDSDREIEHRTGRSIADIFARDGETAFRDAEERIIADLLDRNEADDRPLVLATGGGVVLRSETRRRLREAGLVVWLTASPKTILDRMQSDATSSETRPSLTMLPPLDEIVALLEARESLYRETAHEIFDTEAIEPKRLAESIAERFCRLR